MSRQAKDGGKKIKYFEIETGNRKIGKHQIMFLVSFSVVIVLILEMLSRRSFTKGLTFIVANPIMFLFNTFIVLLTLSISMMFSKRNFILTLITLLWLALGVTNFIILCFRSTPLTAMDFYLLKSVVSIIHVYLDTVKMVLISIIGAVVLASMFFLWRKVKRYQIQIRIPLLIIGISAISMLLLSSVAMKVSALSDDFGNLPDAYADYGFAYCFSNSVFNRGIREPENYSKEAVDKVIREINNGSAQISNDNASPADAKRQEVAGQLQSLDPKSSLGSDVKPNIIMIQLESFFDANELLDYSFSENPIPNFTSLKQNFSTGYLKVPAYGAGTVNTEFEVIAGMSVDFFGTGEYPYRTILQSTTSESICYNLAELGYKSFAIHDNTGTFYNRNLVFPKLGFDRFDSVEYMNDIESNPTGWAKDKVLTGQIMSALNSDETQDFIYTITVQSHGKYQETPTQENRIKIAADPEKRRSLGITTANDTEEGLDSINTDPNYMNQIEYYVNQLSQTDQFIGDLVQKLSNYQEPTIVVFFGDHLPPLSFEDNDLLDGNRFQTEYVMWSNFSMNQVKKNLAAYQLNAYVMDRIGYDNGILTKFHQRCINYPDYMDNLELLQYDMLYGDKYIYGGTNPHQEKTMKMGIEDTAITRVVPGSDVIYIYGTNFTPRSAVFIDDKAKETTFVNSSTLTIPFEELTDPSIYVAQLSDGNKILSQSNTWTASPEK